MRWCFSFGWLCSVWHQSRKIRPIRRWVKYVQPRLEPLEDRRLLSNNVWLPQQLTPFDGATQTNYTLTNLFQPATTSILPQLGLKGTSVAASGSLSLSDNGNYSLSLTQSGPYDGSGDRYTFSESGTVSFALTEAGTFSAAGFSINSYTLTQTATLSWSLVETNSSGQTVQNLSGANTLNGIGNGTAAFDPYFSQGLNWLSLTQKISSLNTLNLANLTASALTVTETQGSESYDFQETNGVATVSGSAQQSLNGSLMQNGQQSYSETAVEQIKTNNQGSDSFSLTELGSYSGSSYALSSVSYQENGKSTYSSNPTVADTQSGTGTASGTQSFSGNNHALVDSSSESFQFNNLSTLSYGETATSNYALSLQGSYGGGSFNLNSMSYSANGSGNYSLTQTSLQTQNGTFSASGNASGADSYGIAGTLSSSGTATTSGNFTSTSNGTLLDNEGGNFTLSEGGAYGNGSWSLSSYSLTESLSGTYSQQQLSTLTQSGNSTLTDSGTGTDSFLLNYSGVVSTSGGDTVNSTDTQTDNFTLTSTNSSTYGGTSSYSLTLLGSLQSGVAVLTSYSFNSGQQGTYTASGSANQTDVGSAEDSASGSDSGNQCSTLGGVSIGLLNNDTFSASDSFSFTSTDSSSSTDSGGFTQSRYLAGVYNNGSYALSSVVSSFSGNDSWSNTDNDTLAALGTDTGEDGGNGNGNGAIQIGGGTFTALNAGTYSDNVSGTFNSSSHDTTTANGYTPFAFVEVGAYGNDSFSFNTVTYQANGTSNDTVQESDSGTFNNKDLSCYTDNSTATANGCYAISTSSGLATANDSSTDSIGVSGTDTTTETTTANDSWNAYELGSFTAGSWSLISASYGDSFGDSFSLLQTDNDPGSGTDSFSSSGTATASGTTVYGGGSANGAGTVASSDSGTDSFSGSSNDTIDATGIDTYLLNEYGSFGNLSFAFNSVVYQGGDSVTDTAVDSINETLSNGTDTGTSSMQGQSNSQGTYASSTDSSNASFSATSNYSFQTGGNDSLSETLSSTDTDTFYDAGQFSGGSLSLSSVAYNSSGKDTWSFQGSDTSTADGPETQTSSGGNSFQMQAGTAGGNSANSNAAQTLTGNAAITATDSLNGGGNDCWSQSDRGSYGNFSYSYSSLVYESNGSDSTTLNETATDCITGTLTGSGGSSNNANSGGQYGYSSFSLQSNNASSGSSNFSETITDKSSDTVSSGDTWNSYEAGSYSGNSLSLTSVSVSDGGSDTWSQLGNDTVTQSGPDTFNAGATLAANITVADTTGSYSNGAVSNLDTITANGTVGGTDTASANDTSNASGGDTWNVSEQGIYGNCSYSFGTVVLQGGGTYGGTFQASSSDTFQGSSTVNAGDSVQQNGSNVLATDNSGGDVESSAGSNLTQTLQANSHANLTVSGSGSYNYYQSGSYAGSSFAFASVSYRSGGNDSVNGTDTATASDTFNGSGTVSNSANSDNTSDIGSVECNGAGSTDNSGGNMSGTETDNESATLSGGDSYSITALGCYSNYSYSLSSYVCSSSDSLNLNSQETDSSTGTWACSGSEGNSGSDNANGGLVAQSSYGTYTINISDTGDSGDDSSFTGTVNSTDTTTVTQVGTFSESLYQAGSYNAGSFAFSSVVYNDSSTTSSTTQDTDTSTANDTRSGNASSNSYHSAPTDDYTNSDNDTYTAQDTSNGGDTTTQSDLSTQTLYEAGAYNNESYSLSSFVLLEQGSDTVTDSSVSSTTSLETGNSSGFYTFTEDMIYDGTGTFSDNSGSNATMQETATDSWELSEQGTFGNGSLSVSSYVFQNQQQSSDSMSSAGGGTQTFSGIDAYYQSYSGSGSGGFSDNGNDSATASLSEQGQFVNGSFTLSAVNFSASGGDSFNDGSSDSSSWSGGYGGAATATADASGNGTWSASASGSYSGGSWSLSSDVVQGSSIGSFSNTEMDHETLGSHSTMSNGNQNTTYSLDESGSETDNSYQAGTVRAGVYSNSSFNLTINESDTTTTSSSVNLPASNSGSDTWQNSFDLTETGSGSIGTLAETSGGTYNWVDDGTGSEGTSGTGSAQSVTLPGAALLLPSPDGTSVPVDGAEQSAGETPVSASPNLMLVAATSAWMLGQSAHAAVAGNQGLVFAADAGTLPANGTGLSDLLYVPGRDDVSQVLLPFNPATDNPTIQLLSASASSDPPSEVKPRQVPEITQGIARTPGHEPRPEITQGVARAPGNAPRPTIETKLPDRVTKELPQKVGRAPAENKQARNFYTRNIEEGRKWWSARNGGQPWPENPQKPGTLQWAEHPRALKDGGDPLYIEPGAGPDPNARHVENGDHARFGKMGGRPPKSARMGPTLEELQGRPAQGRGVARATGKGAARAFAGLSVYLTLRDAAQAAGVAQPDYVPIMAPYSFVSAADGSVYQVEEPSFFGLVGSYKRNYVAGPRAGQSVTITKDQAEADRKLAEATWGRLIPGALFTEPRFIPGTQRSRLPLINLETGQVIGYIDENGVHRYHPLTLESPPA